MRCVLVLATSYGLAFVALLVAEPYVKNDVAYFAIGIGSFLVAFLVGLIILVSRREYAR